MHLLGTVLQGSCDKLERTDHGLQFTVAAEEQFKTFIAVTTQGVDADIDRTHILNADVGATAMTTVTTLVTITALYFLGVSAIKEFALPIIVGVIAGTWSSNLISGYIWAWLEEKFPKKEKSPDEDEDDEE